MQMRHTKILTSKGFPPEKSLSDFHGGELRLLRNWRDIKLNQQLSKVFA